MPVLETIAPPRVADQKLLIDGKWVNSASGKTFETVNPTTGDTICRVAEADKADVDLAVKAARKALESKAWARMSPADRGKLLYKLAELIEANAKELAALETLDNGKPIRDSLYGDIPATAAVYRYFAGWADKVHGKVLPVAGPFTAYTRHEPVGVVGQVIPWNFPALMQAWKWAPALAVGCTVVLKPAEQTPLTALRIAALATEAGFPEGVINVVPGFGPTAGAAIAAHLDIDKVAFTGSTEVGKLIMRAAAESNLKRVTLELGGKSPNIIFADADVEFAAKNAYQALFYNMGQCCCAGSRLFVEAPVYDQVMEIIAGRAKKQVIGDPFDNATTQGPQVSKDQFNTVLRYIDAGKRDGARCVIGGDKVDRSGYFVQPTVFDNVRDDMTIAREEIFGPVLSAMRFADAEEVLQRANNTTYGLAAAVWTKDITKANRLAAGLKAGSVWINCYNVFDCSIPFGGYKMSGIGREMGEYALANYLEVKAVVTGLANR
ncbi:MAG: aldehyde dehydrogenase family protein [Planctomycetes bacterium]|nr:aldehyde dehydrogenase family protein [Planctomycetota bacterium]